MNLIRHIIKKDIVRDCWALLSWAILFVLQIILGLVARTGFGGAQRDHWEFLQASSGGLVLLQMAMGYILVARLVQADPLIGTGAFWPTRPISAGRLLAAKAASSLLLFAVLPVLLLLPWWLHCAFGWRDVLWTAVETMGWQLLMIAPAFLVASLTDDLGRVLLWTLLLVIGLFSWMVLMQTAVARALVGPVQGGSGVGFTRTLVIAGSFVGVAAGVSLHQFLTRRWARSVGLTAIGLGSVVLAGQMWRWDWSAEVQAINQPRSTPVASGLTDGVKFSVGPAGVNVFAGKAGDRDVRISVPISVQGLPEDTGFMGEKISQVWRWPDGLVLNREIGAGYGPFPTDIVLRKHFSLRVSAKDQETQEWYRAKWEETNAMQVASGRPRLPDTLSRTDSSWVTMRVSAQLPKSIAAKARTQPPAYEARIQAVLAKPEIVLQVPLKPKRVGSGQSCTFMLRELLSERLPNDSAEIVTTVSSVKRNGLWHSGQSQRRGSRVNSLRDTIMTVNHTTGDITWVGNNRAYRSVLIGGVMIGWEKLGLRPSTVIREGKLVLADEQWLDHTSLVLLSDREVGRAAWTVRTEKFELEAEKKTNNN